jgi:hypothetical protein
LPHTRALFLDDDIERVGVFLVRRTVVWLATINKLIKFYVCYKTYTKEHLTLVDGLTGAEIVTFHYTVDTREIKNVILDFLSDNCHGVGT